MNFSSILRAFQARSLIHRVSYCNTLARRLSCSSTELKRWSFHDQTGKDYTGLQSFKVKTHSSARWISFQRNCSSLNKNNSQGDRLEKDVQLHKERSVSDAEQEHPNRRTIFVGSLNYLTDEESIQKHFSMYGEIEHIRIIRYVASATRKSYGFVRFKSSESVEKALQGKNFLDSKLLEVARHDRDVTHERKIHVKGIPSELDVSDIKDYFSQYGNVKVIDIPWAGQKRKEYGFVEFSSEAPVIKALQQQLHDVKGHELQVKSCIAKRKNTIPRKLVVDLLPDDVMLEDVRKYFEQFGELNSIDMVFKRDSKNFAFLCFKKREVAEEVSNNVENHFICGQQVIVKPMHSIAKLEPASSREKKVFVEDIPLGKKEDEILAFFNQFGDAIKIHLIDRSTAGHANQCGILRFRRKSDVDTLLAYSKLLMEGCLLKVRRLGFTAKTSSHYTPLYLKEQTDSTKQL